MRYIILIFFLLMSLWPRSSFAAISVGNVTSASDGSPTTSRTIAHTNDGNLIVVGLSDPNGLETNLTSAKYNGVDLEFDSYGGTSYVGMWYMATTSSGNLVIVSTNTRISTGIVSFLEADTTDPIGGSGSANAGTGSPSVDVVTDTAGSIVIDVTAHPNALTVGADQAERVNVGSGYQKAAMSTEPAATTGTYTMSWSATSADWSQRAVEIHTEPVSAAAAARKRSIFINY